jgi:uncharacterized protein DUF6894
MEFTIDSLDEKRRFSLHRYAGNDNWECNKELVTTIRLPIPGGRPTETNMPRYFFNTRIGDELVVDPDGEVLRDPDRAWEVARAMILEILKAEGPHAGLVRAVVEVTDEGGEIVLEFPFTEALLDMPDESMTRH